MFQEFFQWQMQVQERMGLNFITHVETSWLDGKHTVFGKVDSGQDIVDSIQQGDILETIKIEGDFQALLDSNSERVDEWNKILDD